MAHVVERGVFPVVLGGDHSIGYPTIRGMAPYVDGHRHHPLRSPRRYQETDLDDACTPPVVPCTTSNAPHNLVQIGIGGWQSPRAGVKVGRERGTTIVTVGAVERVGIESFAEIALQIS